MVLGCVAVCATIVVGLVALWPRGPAPRLSSAGPQRYVTAEVALVRPQRCAGETPDISTGCREVEAILHGGDDAGTAVTFQLLDVDYSAPALLPGDQVVLLRTPSLDTADRYVFHDLRRDRSMTALLVVFAAAVVTLGRWRGARSLVALAGASALATGFIVPALLRGSPPVPVAVVGAGAIAAATIFLGHGRRTVGVVSFLSIMASLAVVALAGWAALWFTNITGLSDPAMQTLRVTAGFIDPRGVLLAGLVIAALGVLDDVVVTQVAAVVELAGTAATPDRAAVSRAALRIGRDHIGATVNTLFLAYIGTALASMLVFTQGGGGLSTLATTEMVAAEIVRAIAGGLGLIAAVPIATWAAALLVCRTPEPDPPMVSS